MSQHILKEKHAGISTIHLKGIHLHIVIVSHRSDIHYPSIPAVLLISGSWVVAHRLQYNRRSRLDRGERSNCWDITWTPQLLCQPFWWAEVDWSKCRSSLAAPWTWLPLWWGHRKLFPSLEALAESHSYLDLPDTNKRLNLIMLWK